MNVRECASSFTCLHLYAPPQDVGFRVRYRTGAIGVFWPHWTGAMQDRGYGLPRISLPRTPVNKGEMDGKEVKNLASGRLSELPSSEYSIFLRLGVQSR
jgi:hypothetical protein